MASAVLGVLDVSTRATAQLKWSFSTWYKRPVLLELSCRAFDFGMAHHITCAPRDYAPRLLYRWNCG
jgi:hypothetical protein